MLWKKSFKFKLEKVNRVISTSLEELRMIQAEVTSEIENNRVKIQNLQDANSELEIMQYETGHQIEEIRKFVS